MLTVNVEVCSAPVYQAAAKTLAKVTLVDQSNTTTSSLAPPHGVTAVPKPTTQASTVTSQSTAHGSTVSNLTLNKSTLVMTHNL